MNEAAEQALDNFRHEQALSIAHAKRAEGYLSQFLSLVGQTEGHPGVPTGLTVRCVREWTRWLSENGPALKSTIQEATGVRFNERGTPHTFMWDSTMEDDPDDALPPNALMRIRGLSQEGRGAPPVIYFLWSQRYDVHPLFGVGPTMEAKDALAERGTLSEGERRALAERGFSEALTGVLRPPVSSHPIDPAHGVEQTFDWPTDEPEGESRSNESLGLQYLERVTEPRILTEEDEAALHELLNRERCATMEEWDEMHASLFDVMVAAESKPTDEQKATLADTLPPGAEPNAAIAIAYRAAVLRSRQQDGT